VQPTSRAGHRVVAEDGAPRTSIEESHPVDAAAYFALSDRIRDLRTAGDGAALRREIEHATPHPVERRALERRLEATLSALWRGDREIPRQVTRGPGREGAPTGEVRPEPSGEREAAGGARSEDRRTGA